MLKKVTLMTGAFALAFGAFVGCSDATPSAPESTSSLNDAYTVLKISDPSQDDALEVAGMQEWMSGDLMLVDGDTTRPPKGPRAPGDDTLRGPKDPRKPGDTLRDPVRDPKMPPAPGDTLREPKDPRKPGDTLRDPARDPKGPGRTPPRPPKNGGGQLRPGSYERIIKALGLTPEQDASVKICFTEYRDCVGAAQKNYAAARAQLSADLATAIQALRAQVEAGTMTKEEARAAQGKILAEFKANAQKLNEGMKAAAAACKEAFESCVSGVLTPEQLEIWERLTTK